MRAKLQIALLVAGLGLAACSTTFDGIEDTPEQRGKRAFMAGNLGLAITHYQTALDRAPESIEALNGLGASYDRLGRFDVAQRYYDRALKLDRRAAQTLNNIGYSYLLQGKHEIAAAYFKQALDGARTDQVVQANLQLAESAAAAGNERVAAASVKAPSDAAAAKLAEGALPEEQRPTRVERVNATTQKLIVSEPVAVAEMRWEPPRLVSSADARPSAPETAPMVAAAQEPTAEIRRESPRVVNSADPNPRGSDKAPIVAAVQEPIVEIRREPSRVVSSAEPMPVGPGKAPTAPEAREALAEMRWEPPRLVKAPDAEPSGPAKAPTAVASLEVSAASLPAIASPATPERTLPIPPAAIETQPQPRMVIEVSNGAGRNGMAARMRGYLRDHGTAVNRLTNADRFTYRATTIAYKPGSEAAAEALAAALPIECRMTPDERGRSDVRLVLGSDLLGFDAALLLANREKHVRHAAR
jgi:tetratricopeptide (TPR) repeat protein